ncbi:membrane fusion protein (multidrug efflux system) [Myroides gitamensis]|uniref:Multidrug resistance protein MdtE n=1 Tax=Myroides odoratus TaxID=256 RepID=A0A378U3F7_MYROD|nr:efflux RND transporter periplasmic adaptor subunit [Myroides odoratus]MCS4239890.1 membrane fusion protein (multidrug efflux system) [Myroides odoratus]MDH6602614.1 membrane fusion protein (multidrug efflux system) [Myroides gitamensis]QQU03731.1 efflux RND transporter periplasmic adaptor subunit [Myroides odoratus]STZ68990.1 Multidrug resistance protein MdtE precursor [Myroides odoratus]
MKRYLHTIVLGSLSSLAVISCGKKEQAQGGQGPMPYKVVQVPTQDVVGHTSYPTTLQGKVTSSVRAKITGYIQEVYVDEGATVKKGQPLFRLETNILSQNADASKAAIKTAEAQVNVAQVNVDKLIPLVQKGIVSNIQLETAKANLASAQSQVAAARATYNSVVANVDFSIVRSPIDGIVGAIAFREGTLISPSDPTPLTTVSDDSEVFAYFSMNEKEYFNFLEKIEGNSLKEKLGHLPEVKLQLANGTTYQYTGKIETISGQINTATGTVQVRAAFPNKDRILSTGNSGTLLIPQTYKDVMVVPESSTFEQQGQVYVYKVENDTVKSTPIEVIDRVNKLAVVKSGLEKGQTVVATGLGTLRNGSAITPAPTSIEEINNSIKPTF